ncbi:MAG: purU 1 [Ilumatobacteraceae bacterium]|nr:purU 1 [Ilumatobacteraceae bacterium]MCU1390905.1 purU 1 [Ilumatobacteraceae bacterium]
MPRQYVMVVRCDDRPGIVHSVTGAMLAVAGNIIENAQFTDPGSNTFVMRTRFVSENMEFDRVRGGVVSSLAGTDIDVQLRAEDNFRRALIMVSKFDHCLLDLLYRYRTGELQVEIPLVVSNHPDCAEMVEGYGIPYLHMPITADTKAAQEAKLLELIDEHRVDFVVLARYMQVLSEDLCEALRGRAINIHHSFLPGFKGAKPYHQAHARGVKLIGATAHYVTPDLDEGPIIDQDVVRVSHTHDADALVRMGRDVERNVLSRAVQAHAQDRVVLIGDRTVVFP